MTFVLSAYKGLTGLLDPFLPLVLNKRVQSGKEDASRLDERRGYASRTRPAGPLIWMHGASIGESQVLLLLYEALKAERPDVHAVITTQTQTSADLIARRNLPDLIHQMAPLDTPFASKRFLAHWTPDMAVFAEGDIWPNLIGKLDKQRIPRVLINARMTEKSRDGWMRFPALARKIFGGFDQLLAANNSTYDWLRQFAGRQVRYSGNVKYAAPPLPADEHELASLSKIVGDRPVLAALSTHPGEEAVILSVFHSLKQQLPSALLIIAPRHPERAQDINQILKDASVYQRSKGGLPDPSADIWLCDTLGELGLWIRLSKLIYLGGGMPGLDIHGHNPIEPLKLNKPVISLSDISNFQQEFADMVKADVAELAENETDLENRIIANMTSEKPLPDNLSSGLSQYLAGEAPLNQTRDVVLAILEKRRRR